jgi:hypothetical protein
MKRGKIPVVVILFLAPLIAWCEGKKQPENISTDNVAREVVAIVSGTTTALPGTELIVVMSSPSGKIYYCETVVQQQPAWWPQSYQNLFPFTCYIQVQKEQGRWTVGLHDKKYGLLKEEEEWSLETVSN